MKAMLIGLLVIGAVAMLETDAYARHCWPWPCTHFEPIVLEKVLDEAKKNKRSEVLEKVLDEAKKNERSEVWLIGFTDRVGSSKAFGRVQRQMEDIRQILIQRGLSPDIFRLLILEGYAPRAPKRKGVEVMVTWPNSEQYKR